MSVLLLMAAGTVIFIVAGAYPAGECIENCGLSRQFTDPIHLPGMTCEENTTCGSLVYPGSAPSRNTTRCLADFHSTCATQAGCAGCALWNDMLACGTSDSEQCLRRDGYVLLLAKESDDARPDLLCFTRNHWLIIPMIPCTGVESPDPACTGPQGEQLWRQALQEALQLGFPANGSADGQGPTWAVLINPAQRRSQHQMHLRLADLQLGVDVVEELRAAATEGALSINVSAPSMFYSQDIDASLAAVLVEGSWQELERLRPFETAAEIATATQPLNPYGILVSPMPRPSSDANTSSSNSEEEEEHTGFLVAALFDGGSTQILDESTGDECSGELQPQGSPAPASKPSGTKDGPANEALAGNSTPSLAAICGLLTAWLLVVGAAPH